MRISVVYDTKLKLSRPENVLSVEDVVLSYERVLSRLISHTFLSRLISWTTLIQVRILASKIRTRVPGANCWILIHGSKIPIPENGSKIRFRIRVSGSKRS